MKTRLLSILSATLLLLWSPLFDALAFNPPTFLKANIAGSRYNVTDLSIPKNPLVYRYHPTEKKLEIFHHFTIKDSYCTPENGGPMILPYIYDMESGTIMLSHIEAATTPATESGEYMHTGYIVLEGDADAMRYIVFHTLAGEEYVLSLSLSDHTTGCWLGTQGLTSIGETIAPDNNDISMEVLSDGRIRFDFGEAQAHQLALYNREGMRIVAHNISSASSYELRLPDRNEVYIYAITNKHGGVLHSGKIALQF